MAQYTSKTICILWFLASKFGFGISSTLFVTITNIIRKHVINSIKTRLDILGVKRPISRLLFDNLLDPTNIIPFLNPK
jgi:hypothetical protein